ncbi:MAG: hypothetical protein ACJ75B_21055 [Flavisolibacter sp.]
MQYVNDDMDEVFRRAAENYPLDTSNSNWNKVSSALNNTEENLNESPNKKKRFFWLFALIPLSLIGYIYWNPSTQVKQLSVAHQNEAASVSSNKQQGSTHLIASSDKTPQRVVPAPVSALPSKISASQSSLSNSIRGEKTPKPYSSKYIQSDKNNVLDEETTQLTGNQAMRTGFISLNRSFNRRELQPLTPASKTIAPHFISSVKKEKRFYLGLFGGVDVTSVRFQKVENAGFDYGALVGYRLNRRWSIEAGVFRDKKFYYTEGQYFNNSKILMPPNSWITNVWGNCKMLEVPVSVKYDFSSAKKSSWFSTVGLSSYFMKREDYNYEYYYATSGVLATHYRSYTNSSKNLFSVLQVSGGYEHQMGSAYSIRIEPYLKLPVTGVGFGQIHMVSAGMHVGIVRRMF